MTWMCDIKSYQNDMYFPWKFHRIRWKCNRNSMGFAVIFDQTAVEMTWEKSVSHFFQGVSNFCDNQYCATLTFWLGYLSARCARSTCLRQGGNRNQNVHYAVLSMHGSFRVLKPNLTIIIKPKMGMSS